MLRKKKTNKFKTVDEEIDHKMGRLVRAIKLSQEGEKLLSQDYNQRLDKSV
jgi:hypothetical protein